MKSITRRIETLEASLSHANETGFGRRHGGRKRFPLRPPKLRFGNLRPLPLDYEGERHVEIVKQLPSRGAQDWVEYEEVAGSDPNPWLGSGLPESINVIFVAPKETENLKR